jgi:predicted HD phosphohydrolase
MQHVKFVEVRDSDAEDCTFLRAHELAYTAQTAGRLVHALEALEDSIGGYQVSRLIHSLQSATRAHRDGQTSTRL